MEEKEIEALIQKHEEEEECWECRQMQIELELLKSLGNEK